MTLSVVMVTYNAKDVVGGALESIKGIADEVLVGDGGSRDGTVDIVRKFGAKIIQQNDAGSPIRSGMTNKNLGERKQELVEMARGEWILVLDADERVSEELVEEICVIANKPTSSETRRGFLGRRKGFPRDDNFAVAYRIPYQNYVFGKPVYFGGEKYAKVRLFRGGCGRISPELLHEEIKLDPRLRGDDNRVGELKGKMHHHSYRSSWQLISKFTRYAWMAAEKEIASPSERSRNDIVRRIFLHGPHMFWARFVTEMGYKDGWHGLVLAAAFGYMEGLTYWFSLVRNISQGRAPSQKPRVRSQKKP